MMMMVFDNGQLIPIFTQDLLTNVYVCIKKIAVEFNKIYALLRDLKVQLYNNLDHFLDY